MVPPGCGLTEIVGEYKVERETPGEILYKPMEKKRVVIKLDESKTHIISALVLHKPGVLQRVAGLFTRRGFNIENITVGTSEQENLARMTIIAKGDEKVLEQITKQLNKLIDVIKVRDLDQKSLLKGNYVL